MPSPSPLPPRNSPFKYMRDVNLAQEVADMLQRTTGQACYVHTVMTKWRHKYYLIMREIAEGEWVEN